MLNPVFTPIEPRTMHDEIVDLIRDAALRGDVELGQHLPEQELAEQMRVSRIPIREAMRQLEQEGLIVRVPNRGCFVADFTEQDVTEIFSLRATLEMMAIELATPHLTAQDIADLRKLIEAQQSAIEARDYNQLTQLDLKFHEYICIKANHQRLLKTWRSQYVQALILINWRFRLLPHYTPHTVVPDHTQITAALERGDAQAAMELTRAISRRVTEECIEVIRHKRQEAITPERSSLRFSAARA